MKKFISLLLIFTLVFCFAACGGNETPDENINNNSVVDNNTNLPGNSLDNNKVDNVTSSNGSDSNIDDSNIDENVYTSGQY